MLDASGVLEEVRARYIGDPAFSNLPRKFKTSISGCSVHCTNHEINDVAFVGVRLPDGTVGYDLWVGGGLSTNPKLAVRLGAFVEPARVAEVWAGVTSVFRDYGYRRSRMHARLKFLLADWGPEKFRQVLEDEYLTAPAARRPGARRRRRRPSATTSACTRRATAASYVGAVPRAGRTSGRQLQRVAELAALYGDGQVSTTAQQGLVVLGVPDEHLEPLVGCLEAEDLRVQPVGVPPRHAGLHRASSSASWRSSRPRPARSTSTPSSRSGCPTSTSRSRSTSTAARTRAPASRPATSASRARSSTARRASRSTSADGSARTPASAASRAA